MKNKINNVIEIHPHQVNVYEDTREIEKAINTYIPNFLEYEKNLEIDLQEAITLKKVVKFNKIILTTILFFSIFLGTTGQTETATFLGIEQDKILHFSAGYIIFTGSSWFQNQWSIKDETIGTYKKFISEKDNKDPYRIFSWLCVITIASLKEGTDTQWDWNDWTATILGAGVGSIIVYTW